MRLIQLPVTLWLQLVDTAATCLTRRRRLDQWNIERPDSTGVSALVIGNVATRVVVEVVVDKWLIVWILLTDSK